MRAIRFRAWDKEGSTMVKHPLIGSGTINSMNGWFDSEHSKRKYEFTQYTGLQDVKGEDIYEGDIVTYLGSGLKAKSRNKVVKWNKERHYVGWNIGVGAEKGIQWMVIGNIYENKDLLQEVSES